MPHPSDFLRHCSIHLQTALGSFSGCLLNSLSCVANYLKNYPSSAGSRQATPDLSVSYCLCWVAPGLVPITAHLKLHSGLSHASPALTQPSVKHRSLGSSYQVNLSQLQEAADLSLHWSPPSKRPQTNTYGDWPQTKRQYHSITFTNRTPKDGLAGTTQSS